MQDTFREVLRDIVYRRWKLAVCYRNSIELQEMLYGNPPPASLVEIIREAEDLLDYLESDPMFSPDRNLPVRACTLRVCA